MTRPSNSSKLLLVADRRPSSSGATPSVRRYRIARLRLEDRAAGGAIRTNRFERS